MTSNLKLITERAILSSVMPCSSFCVRLILFFSKGQSHSAKLALNSITFSFLRLHLVPMELTALMLGRAWQFIYQKKIQPRYLL